MPSLKSLKIRISSVKSTQKITKAMQLISASRLHKAKEALQGSIPYQEEMKSLLRSAIPVYMENSTLNKIIKNNDSSSYLVIVVTSDRGLCGAFNSNVIKKAKSLFSELASQKKKVSTFFIGKKGYELLNSFCHFEKCYALNHAKDESFYDALRVAGEVLELFREGEFDTCIMVYNEFVSTITQRVVQNQLIPVLSEEIESDVSNKESVHSYEPSMEELQEQIIERYIATQIYHVLLENAASEHSARMIAMDNATRNSKTMIQKLSNVYNRTRQANITKELTEIISGAQAISG